MNKKFHSSRQILTWEFGERLFGVDINDCREVDRNKDIVQVPHAKEVISGIVNLRGEIVTVVDLGYLLGHTKKVITRDNVIIRLKSRTKQLALIADKVRDVVHVSAENIEAVPAHLSELEQRYIDFVAATENDLIVVLNPGEIIRSV